MGIVQYGKVSLALSNKLNTLNIQSHATRPYIIASVLVWQTFCVPLMHHPKHQLRRNAGSLRL